MLKWATVIIFSVALCRIAWLLNKLKKFGYVGKRFILRIHIACCFFDLIYNLVSSYLHLILLVQAISYRGESQSEETTYDYYVDPRGTAIGLVIYQSYAVLNQFMMLVVCYKIWEYI